MKTTNTTVETRLRQVVIYTLALGALVGVVILGSVDKSQDSSATLNMTQMADSNYQVSTDQLSEMYVVASLSNTFTLASSDTVSNNYVIVQTMQDVGQSSTEKVVKPNITDTSNICQGICSHTVAEGETVESIAAYYGLTTDQLRWSNSLKNTEVSVGRQLYIPGVPGIVYTVKNGDTAASIAEKYGSTATDIAALNDNLTPGTKIIIPDGVLPETERPEYVAPSYRTTTTTTTNYTYTYTYSGSSSGRDNMSVIGYYYSLPNNEGNKYVAGQCTWYAWWWRKNDPSSLGALPNDVYGNANSWASIFASRGVGRTPAVGAVFQTSAGYYGHVGVVTGMNADGSITVREMNFGISYRVTESTIPANQVGNFLYIY